MEKKDNSFILGAGMSGLAAGLASGMPVFEASDSPGGICSSYYVRPGENIRLLKPPEDQEAYRFEIGGGHWIFGGEPSVLHMLRSHIELKDHVRRSAVYFHDRDLYVPYPIQNHLRFMEKEVISHALAEMAQEHQAPITMKEWMTQSFGPTLCRLFFYPFHQLYTAGLYDRIAPQDAYKSPVDLKLVKDGALSEAPAVGYNATFIYPPEGLDTLARRMASQCKIYYNHKIEQINVLEKRILFADGKSMPYDKLISTLPLNKMMEITGIKIKPATDPHTSVLVINIGATRGERCPDHHWLYNTNTSSGFHRVGFYSNVDESFLPKSAQGDGGHVSIYVERAFARGSKPEGEEITRYGQEVVKELQEWGFIGKAEVVDPTWIEVAYTWNWTGSDWVDQTLKKLHQHDIYQVGRYGRWSFQGIADSIRDGFFAGKTCPRDIKRAQ